MKTLFSVILLLSLLATGFIPKALGAAAPRPAQKSSAKKRPLTAKQKPAAAAAAKKKAAQVRRARRAKRAFVASADLKPMARQLFENRSPAAYAGVEAYARKHSTTDAGALARLALGYAHILDKDYVKAIDPLKRAKTRAGELDDYIAYLLAVAYDSSGDSKNAIATLSDFDAKYSDSVFARDASVLYASALIAQERATEAVTLLEAHRTPTRSDIDVALGRAYLRAGQSEKAATVLRHVYYKMPQSAEADDARALLASMAAPPASFAERKTRADLLFQARRYRDAATEYRDLLPEASADDRLAVQLSLGVALHRSGNDPQAREMLESLAGLSPEQSVQRLAALVDMARSANDEDRFSGVLSQLREAGPTSPAFEDALLSGGNMYLLAKKYDRAIDFYRELQQRFPQGRYGAYSHWKAAWLTLRQGRAAEAKEAFEQHVALYPNSPQVPAALYWRARLADEDGENLKARAWYEKVAARFPNYYYADLARARLKGAKPAEAEVDADPLLQKIAATQVPASFSATAPSDDLHYERSLLLRNAGMFDFAAKELQFAATNGGAGWAPAEMARLYQDSGEYYRALQTLKRAVPTYYSLDIGALPRFYWEALFPRPYWTDLKKFSVRNQLDPFLVASLIRQESEFNPGAVSRANAMGLMQLLPGTGRSTARELRVRGFSTNSLLEPNMNLELGTTFFRHMLERFDGRMEYALAAYNAGVDRVETWLQDGKFRDPEEFVESIPFTETREYVQAIMRNASVYRRLYATP